MKTLTYKDAILAINNAMSDYSKFVSINPADIETITYAVNNDLQIRDYLIGLPATHGLNISAGFLSELSENVGNDERYAYDTVNAMYHYELENFLTCEMLLDDASTANPDYSLTKLVKRVLQAGWPSNSLATMRSELAHKVEDFINENVDTVIGGN